MSDATTVNINEIQEISQPRTVSSSQLKELARKAEILATAVEKRWSEFSPQERTLLEAVIYNSIEPASTHQSPLSSLLTRLSFAWMLLRSDVDSFVAYRNAVQRLKNAVLGAIERSHPTYEQTINEVLSEALADSNDSSAMTTEEFRDWIANIQD